MHYNVTRNRLTAAATAVALALTVGLTATPAGAATGANTADTGAGAAGSAAAAGESGRISRWVTLITGDRIGVDAKGQAVTIQQAKGREQLPVQLRTVAGHSYAIPLDAQRLVSQGTLDERLFDVTTLSGAAYTGDRAKNLSLIVDYQGAGTAARRAVRAAGDTEVRRSFPQLNAEAVRTPVEDTPSVWDALTTKAAGSPYREAAAGVGTVWLDAVREASLDKSTKQIGADKAWAAGYDGTGVKIAVLDTGVDKTHPDLKGKVIAEKNFSTAKTLRDGVGHGTHVASIAAGTGAKSGGKYKGVAPGAKLLAGKVLDDEGYGEDSGILAGIEWAAAQGADIVNLSLGGPDTPEIDPLEAAINKLSAEKGILFAVAAGNSGYEGAGSVGSPGSADAALTVGAVDDNDKLADFSSIGPRNGDSAVKPDVTAPGVDITAASAPGSLIAQEVGEQPAGYTTISGTSMATPHVAGAAALLKQQHPDWKGDRLKSVLTGSAKGGKYTPYQQGSGRIDLGTAIKQTVFAEGAVSLSLGKALWPHTDDKPVTKKVVYRNTGTTDITLNLALTTAGPSGAAAPAGFFALDRTEVTVPAGGTAEAALTADTRLGGTKDGFYSAYVTATGGGQTVRTAAAVEREVESYDVTVKFIGRNGKAAAINDVFLAGLSGSAKDRFLTGSSKTGTVKLRVPKGGYLLSANILVSATDPAKGVDWIAQPSLAVAKNTTVTVDARTAKPATLTVPTTGATQVSGIAAGAITTQDSELMFGWMLPSFKGFRSAHLGPKITNGSLSQLWSATFTKGGATEYDLLYGGKVTQLSNGITKKPKAADLAKLSVGLGSSVKNKNGVLLTWGALPGSDFSFAVGTQQKLPARRTVYLSTADKAGWAQDFYQLGPVDQYGYPALETVGYETDYQRGYKAGKSYTRTYGSGVFSPQVTGYNGISRQDNDLFAFVGLFSDGQGHAGESVYSSGRTILYRNGAKIGDVAQPVSDGAYFTVPAAQATYKLTTTVKRPTSVARVSTQVDASWTFTSKKATSAALPLSTVKFQPTLGLDSTAKANVNATFPVKVQGAAAAKNNLKALTVYVSYDGKTWKKVTVKNGKITVKNPKAGKGISFRANVTDKKGNVGSVTVYNAYLGK